MLRRMRATTARYIRKIAFMLVESLHVKGSSMRQTFMIVTCDKCGIRETFETLLVSCDSPMVATLDPVTMLERRGWASQRNGLRGVDICNVCRKLDEDK